MILCCEMNNNCDYFSDYNRTNTIYNRCIPSSGTIFPKAIAGGDCGGMVGSFTILVALLEHRVRKISRMEGRGMIFSALGAVVA